MKFIHISDLHIGKRLYEFSLLEDQVYILNEIIKSIKEEKIDGLLIAGDIYDKPVPPAEAVRVFDAFLTEVARLGVSVFMISGNHDSGDRLSFGANLMKEQKVYISSVYEGVLDKIVCEDTYGKLNLYLMPFLKPAIVKHAFPEKEIHTYEDAVRVALEKTNICPKERNLLVAHQFVTGAKCCESEELFVGGLDQVPATLFESFDYVALGHIHSPQNIGKEWIRYCGTPLKYSFSEEKQEKTVTILEVAETVSLKTKPLKPRRELRTIKGTYLEVTTRDFYKDMDVEDYIQVILTDEDDILDGLQKLRSIYPNIMHMEYDNERTRGSKERKAIEAVEEKSEMELMEEFYEMQNGKPLIEEQREFLIDLMEECKGGNR